MSNELPYIVEPNRIISSGAETLDAIGLLLVVDSDELRMEARTGPTTDREIAVEYDRIRDVDLVDGVAPDLKIETHRSEYVVTGVADSLRRARRIADAVSRQAGLQVETDRYNHLADQSQSGPDRSRTGQPPASNDGGQPDRGSSMREMDDGSSAYPKRILPSETFSCPTCDKTVKVPAELPEQIVEVNCPGCNTVLGRVGDDRKSIIIDPD